MAEFNRAYLDEAGELANLPRDYGDGRKHPAPLFSWQRPTGRLHEPQFFAACRHEFEAFLAKARDRLPAGGAVAKQARVDLGARVETDMERIRVVAENWFGFDSGALQTRGSFRGRTTRDIHTKAAHFALLREMLPKGRIVLTTEQETMLTTILPHIFAEEIRENRFTWLAMGFNKTATKP